MQIIDEKTGKPLIYLAEFVFVRLPKDRYITTKQFRRTYPELPVSAIRKAFKYLLYLQALEVGPQGYKPLGEWGWYVTS